MGIENSSMGQDPDVNESFLYLDHLYDYWFTSNLHGYGKVNDWFINGMRKDQNDVVKEFLTGWHRLIRLLSNQPEIGKNIVFSSVKRFGAIIVALDQLPRYFFPVSSTYLWDERALELSIIGINFWTRQRSNWHILWNKETRDSLIVFVMMPFLHSNSMIGQNVGVEWSESLVGAFQQEDNMKLLFEYQKMQKETLNTFGRFPQNVPESDLTKDEFEYIKNTEMKKTQLVY